MNNLGNLLYRQGNLAEAKVSYKRALAGYEKAHGAEHPGTLMSFNNLAGLIFRESDFAGAEGLYREALVGYQRTLGAEHPFTLSCIYNLGVLLQEKGDSAGSEAMHQRALAGREKLLGTKHPDTLMRLAALESLRGLKCAPEAIERLMQAVLSDKAIPTEKRGAKVASKSVTEVLQTLNDRERRVLAMRFGLEDGNVLTSAEIGKALNVNQSRIRMIQAKAIRKLKAPARMRILQGIDASS
jgi:RNA polymerase sigma factor (sigma-70 family)